MKVSIKETHWNAYLFFKSKKCYSMAEVSYANFLKYSLSSNKLVITLNFKNIFTTFTMHFTCCLWINDHFRKDDPYIHIVRVPFLEKGEERRKEIVAGWLWDDPQWSRPSSYSDLFVISSLWVWVGLETCFESVEYSRGNRMLFM